ncbi:hypothetical protein A2U01_0113250, partial [Trifolium medium]|nr:hypothetical protein [Trifolium medium]
EFLEVEVEILVVVGVVFHVLSVIVVEVVVDVLVVVVESQRMVYLHERKLVQL